jgi:hypothetical protein
MGYDSGFKIELLLHTWCRGLKYNSERSGKEKSIKLLEIDMATTNNDMCR